MLSEKARNYLLHPKCLGALKPSDVRAPHEALIVAEVGHPQREGVRLMLRLRKADETILDARFQTLGGNTALVSGSCLCEQIIGRTLGQALSISIDDLDRQLGGLPELATRRPVLILIALDHAARIARGQPLPDVAAPHETVICNCFHVPESIIERAVRLQRLSDVDDVTRSTGACGGCRSCFPEIEEILAHCKRGEYTVHVPPEDYRAAQRLYGAPPPSPEELLHNPPPTGAPDAKPSPVFAQVLRLASRPQPARAWIDLNERERAQRVAEVLESDLRPALRADGGDVRLVRLQGNRVLVSLHGQCRNCASVEETKRGIRHRLRQAVWSELEIDEAPESER